MRGLFNDSLQAPRDDALLVDILPYARLTVRVLPTAAFGVDSMLRIWIEIAWSFCETDGIGDFQIGRPTCTERS